MTLALVSPNSSFEAANIGFVPPVADASLKLWHFFGSAAGPFGKNLVVGGADSAVVGSPVLLPRYASFKGGTNYLQSAQPQTGDFTFIVVARSTDTFDVGDHQPMFISNYQNRRISGADNTVGVSLYISSPSPTAPAAMVQGQAPSWTGVAGSSSNLVAAVMTIPDATVWRCFIFSKVGLVRNLYDKTANVAATKTSSASELDDLGVSPLRIGSCYTGFTGKSDMAMAAIYDRGLSAAEASTMYSFLKVFYAKRGIAI